MIVASYNSSDDHGGAAKAAFRLNAALRSAGIEAFLACRHKRTRSKYSIRMTARRSEMSSRLVNFEQFWMRSGRNLLVNANRTGLSSTIFTIDPFGFDVTEAPLASLARVHHLHWCREFISPAALKCIRATGRPIFITLHDQWWMTGGCHYSAGCNKYEKACTQCPQLFSDPAGVAQASLEEKIKAFAGMDVTVIAPSEWMADCARKSAVFDGADVRVVRNPVDIETFKPLSLTERAEMRDELGFGDKDVVLLFGAQTLTDRRKGFTELVEALKLVKVRDDQRLCLASFGRPSKNALSAIGVPTVELGEISNDTRLASIYSAADFFVIPSLEDNYPNTVVESLSCGTPVIGFAAGGIKDLVDGSTTGILAEQVGDVACLAEAITTGIENFFGDMSVRDKCRVAVEAPHDPQNIAAEMIALYADKDDKFFEPLNKEEVAIIQATEKRNSTGKATFAKLDVSSSVFNSEPVMRTLLPAFQVYQETEERIASIQQNADLTIPLDTLCSLGRGQDGVKYLGKGWATPYLNGVWTAAARAHMHLFFDEDVSANQLEFVLNARKGERVVAIVHQGGAECGSFEVEGARQRRIVVPISKVSGPCYLNLTLELRFMQEEGAGAFEGIPAMFVSEFKIVHGVAPTEPEQKKGHWLMRLIPLRDSAETALSR